MNSPTESRRPMTLQELLLDNLTHGFDLSEIKDLCLRLQVNYQNLPGETLTEKASALIAYLDRRSQLDELVALGKVERPKLRWELLVSAGSGDEKVTPSEARRTEQDKLPKGSTTEDSGGKEGGFPVAAPVGKRRLFRLAITMAITFGV